MGRGATASGTQDGLGRALVLVALLALARLLVSRVLLAASGHGPLPVDGWSVGALALSAALSLGGIVWLGLLRKGRRSPRALGWTTERLAPDVVLGIVGALVASALLVGVQVLAHADPGGVLLDWASASPGERLFYALVGVEAALVEESLFRGALQPALQARMGRITGLLVGALVFTAAHLKLGPWALLGTLALGLVLGALRERTGRLVAPAVANALVWTLVGFG